jgi:hypothetical protein
MGISALGKTVISTLWNNKFSVLMNTHIALSTYKASRDEGSGVISSMAATGLDLSLSHMLGWKAYLALEAAKTIPALAVTGMEEYGKYERTLAKDRVARPFGNAVFEDSRNAFTMRQAGMALAQKSKYSMQQAMLGNEAQYMHK